MLNLKSVASRELCIGLEGLTQRLTYRLHPQGRKVLVPRTRPFWWFPLAYTEETLEFYFC